ncbi:MAG: hypothetical protein PUA95_06775 [Lactimicrobium massiliense]|nr:hypothetical protein [Lactimicrobium massiliense]MDD6230419.1 hypothetical protein [Lactimicrobium massiliense]MDD6457190.1 hypothetical protein [Lactimicrobium massiliense]MDD6560977.1 hypothetical protein [Lactimicrobium massiliense]
MIARSKTGFELDIDVENVADNWETLELMAEADAGSIGAMIKAMKQVLGAEGYTALKDHVRSLSKTGKVSTKAMQSEFTSLMESTTPTKN